MSSDGQERPLDRPPSRASEPERPDEIPPLPEVPEPQRPDELPPLPEVPEPQRPDELPPPRPDVPEQESRRRGPDVSRPTGW